MWLKYLKTNINCKIVQIGENRKNALRKIRRKCMHFILRLNKITYSSHNFRQKKEDKFRRKAPDLRNQENIYPDWSDITKSNST